MYGEPEGERDDEPLREPPDDFLSCSWGVEVLLRLLRVRLPTAYGISTPESSSSGRRATNSFGGHSIYSLGAGLTRTHATEHGGMVMNPLLHAGSQGLVRFTTETKRLAEAVDRGSRLLQICWGVVVCARLVHLQEINTGDRYDVISEDQ